MPHTKNRKFLAGVQSTPKWKCNYLCCEQLLLILLNVATRTQHGLPASTAAAAAHGTRTRKTNLIKYRKKVEQSREASGNFSFRPEVFAVFCCFTFYGFYYYFTFIIIHSRAVPTAFERPLRTTERRCGSVCYLIYLLCMSWHHN